MGRTALKKQPRLWVGALLAACLFLSAYSPVSLPSRSPAGQILSPENAAGLVELAGLSFQPWELVTALAWSPDGDLLAVGSGDRVRLYNGESLEAVDEARTGALTHSLEFSPDGSRLAAAGRDGAVRVWSLSSGQGLRLERTIDAHRKGANAVHFSPDGRFLASSGNDAMARVWDIESGEAVNEVIGGAFAVPALAYSPDGALLVLVNGDVARVRAAADGRMLGAFRAETSFFSLALSPDGERLALGDGENGIWLWDAAQVFTEQVREPAPLLELQAHTGRSGGYSALVWNLDFAPGGQLLASAGGDGAICLWQVADGARLNCLPAHRLGAAALAFRPDGQVLASGGLDGRVRLWGLNP